LVINEIVEQDSLLISATEGGLLVFDRAYKTFTTLTNIDELISTDIRALALDPYGGLWIGGSTPRGLIQVYDLKARASRNEFDFGLTEIVDFAITDSIVLGLFLQNQDWGLVNFIYQDGEYGYKDVFRNWPVSINTMTSVAIMDDRVYVGSDKGLFVGDLKTANLKDPNSWTQPYPDLLGPINNLKIVGSSLVVVSGGAVYQVTPTKTNPVALIWDYFDDEQSFQDVILTKKGKLYGVLERTFLALNATGIEWQTRPGVKFRRLYETADGTFVAGTETGLVFVDVHNRTFQRVMPNAPHTNHFTALTVLKDGRLVAGANTGLAIYDVGQWKNILAKHFILSPNDLENSGFFLAETVQVDFRDVVADLEEGPIDGKLYCAINGTYPEPRRYSGGIIILDVDQPDSVQFIDTTYLDYFKDEYMVVNDLEFDSQGNLWVADAYATAHHEPLKVRSPDNQWRKFSLSESQNTLSLTPSSIGFDSWGRVWIGAFENEVNVGNAKDGGLTMLNFSGDPTDPSTPLIWYHLDDLLLDQSNRTLWSLIVGSRDILYLLTPYGLGSVTLQFSDLDPIKSYGFTYYPNIPFSEGSKVRLDPRGNIWTTSPSKGVHILTTSSSYWPTIDGFLTTNSLLLSDEVTDLAFDSDRGLAYIATTRGISVLKIPFAKVNKTYRNVEIFPSPFHIPSATPLVIDGLMDETTCKVMTLTGRVIRTIETSATTEGYQAFWDGRDEQGQWVGSGVYLLALFNKNGSRSFQKITVIRH
jgi:ligand-binding sensor domain-containing protein